VLLAFVPERVPMLVIVALAALLLGGTVAPSDGLPGGPSVSTNATTIPSGPVDDGLNGGPS